MAFYYHRKKQILENLLEILCRQWEKNPADEFTKNQIEKYATQYEQMFKTKYKRIYKK